MESTDIVVVIAGPEEDGSASALSGHWGLCLPARDMHWPWTVKVVSYSVGPMTDRLPTVTPPLDPITGWDIVRCLSGASLVHVSRPHTRAGELAVLAGRVLGKRIVMSEIDTETSPLGRSFGLVGLADDLICPDPAELSGGPGEPSVNVLALGRGEWIVELRRIYRRLLPEQKAHA